MFWVIIVILAILGAIAAVIYTFIVSRKGGLKEDMSEKEAYIMAGRDRHRPQSEGIPVYEKTFGKKKTLHKTSAQANLSWAEIGQGFREKNFKVIFTLLGVLLFILVVFWIVTAAFLAGW